MKRYQTKRYQIQQKDDTMQMNSKLYLQIILLINYMMDENLFVYIEWSPVQHATSRFSVRKDVTAKKKERKKENDT